MIVRDGVRDGVVVVDLDRATLRRLMGGFLLDDIAAGPGGPIIQCYQEDEPSSVWWLEPSGELRAFEALIGRRINGLDMAPDGSVVVGVPHPGRGFGARDLLVLPGEGHGPELRYQGSLEFWSPSLGPDGSVAAIEDDKRQRRPGRKRLVIVRPDGSVERPEIPALGRNWFPKRVRCGPSGLLALEGRLGRNEDIGRVAMAVLDGRFQVLHHFEEWKPLAWAPDGSGLVVTWRGRVLAVVETKGFSRAWTVATFEYPVSAKRATWLEDAEAMRFGWKPGPAGDVREPDIDFGNYRTWLIDSPPPQLLPLGGIRLAEGNSERPHLWSGTVRVQLRGAAPELLAAALAAARNDLYWLDTSPQDEGTIEIPSHVSPVRQASTGPWVEIDANDTDAALLERIPEILHRHLVAAGVQAAIIDLDPDLAPGADGDPR